MKVALAGLLACLAMAAACGEDVAPTATAPPAPAATPTATLAPTPASTPTATPAPARPDDFLDAALERMAEAGSVAFVMRMEMQAETEEGLRGASAEYAGDARRLAYTTGTLAVNGLADATEARFVTLDSGIYEARYALDDDAGTWRTAEPLPEFMQLAHFLKPGNLVQEGFLPPQTLNGVERRGVAGRYISGSPGIPALRKTHGILQLRVVRRCSPGTVSLASCVALRRHIVPCVPLAASRSSATRPARGSARRVPPAR